MGFFKDLQSYDVCLDVADILDWLLTEHRFDSPNWNQTMKGRFTKRLKRLEGFDGDRFAKKDRGHPYPRMASARNRKRKPLAVFSSRRSLGEDFVRHVRNGIAHGHATCYTANRVPYVEIRDYNRGSQTAFVAMPIEYLGRIRRIYVEVEEGR